MQLPEPEDIKRNLVVALDLSDQSHKCLQWCAFELARPGDVVHLVHVARCVSPQTTIQHAYPGSSYTVPDPNPIDQKAYSDDVREVINSKFAVDLEQRKIPHALHLFLDTVNAPASAVCASIFKVADQVKAAVIVMACHNKSYTLDSMLLGSVADYATQNSTYPVIIIRDYKKPFILSASSKDHPIKPLPEEELPSAS